MSTGLRESHFESHLVAWLCDPQGGGYQEVGPGDYDRELCLIPGEFLAFVQASQPEAYAALQAQYGERLAQQLPQLLADRLKKAGALDALRSKLKTRGVHLDLYYPAPRNDKNPEHAARHRANRFTVVRQLKYSQQNENSLDLVLFLNGIPLLTAELKNANTGQYLAQAIAQYRQDRDPKEPLLAYKRCLVHFAVSTEAVAMTTRLAGEKTYFLPFNQGIQNPPNPDGFSTAYLWQEVWVKDNLLDLIQNFVHEQRETEKYYDPKTRQLREKEKRYVIFPRYHQWRVVRRLLSALREEGVGQNYLIQHSAGSGKSNSIAWLAHRLSNFFQHPSDARRLFDSIIVVTDRRVLDQQLQHNIRQFEQVSGVVEAIDDKKTSADLKQAIEQGKTIIITTLQKFPVISAEVGRFPDRRYAVIIDEAHSSQTGESARHLRKALSLEEAEAQDEAPPTTDELVLEEIQRKGKQPNLSFFAFTATPKNKTLELFGRLKNGELRPFDEYSMEQAIHEGFILDVLQAYTSFQRYYRLARRSDVSDKEYETRKTIRLLNSYVDLQDHAIELKSRIMLEHVVSKTEKQIQGRARAMLVTRSRLHAVRYKRKFDALMREMQLPYGCLVAFSGTVYDPDTDEEYTETRMNQLGGKFSIPDAFKLPQHRILIVANKYQTGFDEPLLHTMFVDKKLGDVSTVQTLSRLNRRAPGKDSTMVLDFVNDPENVREDFQQYYQASFMAEENQTDPDALYALQRKVDAPLLFDERELDIFTGYFFRQGDHKEKLQPILKEIAQRFTRLEEEEQVTFRQASRDFVRLYRFLSQLITFQDVELEKYYVLLALLLKHLPAVPHALPKEVLQEVELDSYKVQHQYTTSLAMEPSPGEFYGLKPGGEGTSPEEEFDLLSNIIKTLNETYGLDLSEEDRLEFERIRKEVNENQELLAYFSRQNARSDIKDKFDQVIDDELLQFINTKLELYNKLTEDRANETLKQMWFNHLYDTVVRKM